MKTPLSLGVLGLLILCTASGACAQEQKSVWQPQPRLKTHTVAAANHLSGPGQDVAGLPMTYHMSLSEWNWGGRQSLINGSGITTNSNFPLVEGEALSTNTDVALEALSSTGWTAGIQGETYALAGNRTVGRVFGEELPWDNFDRVGGALVPSRFNLDVDRGWLRYAGSGPWWFQWMGGTLPPKDLPEFTRKTMNQIKLGSLVWRPPIINASFLEKSDRKLEDGRHPVRGTDLIADFEYTSQRHARLELFSGLTKPTPIANIERLTWGGRLAADLAKGNAGVTFVRVDGDKPRSERETQWGIDGSYPLFSWLTAFGAWIESSYTRASNRLRGEAYVGGLAFQGPRKSQAKVQYQWVGENYDLIGTHKVEHYPSNLRGVNAEGALPVGPVTIKGALYYLRQMETNTKTDDTLFGDSYFPALANSKPGTITFLRLGAESKPLERVTLKGYAEQAQFRKDALSDADDIDKRVLNFLTGPSWAVTPHWFLDLNLRHVVSTGRWQAMRFHSRQTIPELIMTYKKSENLRASLSYQWIDFSDSISASAGQNDYEADLVLADFLWKF